MMGRISAALLLLAVTLAASPAAGAEDGYRLFAEERYAEAAKAFSRQGGDTTTHAAALIRLGRDGEAALLTGDVDPYRAILKGAAALTAAGERGRAAQLLDAGLAQWPQDPDLMARRGQLEMQANRPLKALPYLARVSELAPNDPGARLNLVRALQVAGMPVRVHQSIEAMRKAGIDIGPELMDADMDALQAIGDHRKAVALTERYLDLGGVATRSLLTRLSISLEAIGSTTRAAERRRAAASLRAPKSSFQTEHRLYGDDVKDKAKAAIERADWQQASWLVSEWSAVRPDDPEAIQALLRPEIVERLGWGFAFARIDRLIERDPDDPARRLRAIRAHAATGGSSVLALIHAHHMNRLTGAGDANWDEAQRLREQIHERLALLGRIADLDIEQARLRLAPSGSAPIEARVHPRTGRMISLTEGFDRMEAHWDASGTRLEELADSRGARVRLSWTDGRLAALQRSGKHPFVVELAADGRPTRAEGPDVTDAYNATLDLIAAWQRADIADARRLRLGE